MPWPSPTSATRMNSTSCCVRSNRHLLPSWMLLRAERFPHAPTRPLLRRASGMPRALCERYPLCNKGRCIDLETERMELLTEFETDIVALVISVLSVVAYYLFLSMKVREYPTYTLHGVHELARRLWVANIMRNPAQGIMGVQTLRNWIMGSTLMASTAAILIIGTLTLSGQAESITRSWHVLSMTSSHAAELWIVKVMALLITINVAFFAFAMSVRLANHVMFIINVPEFEAHHKQTPKTKTHHQQQTSTMFSIGMRAFLFAIPLVFW